MPVEPITFDGGLPGITAPAARQRIDVRVTIEHQRSSATRATKATDTLESTRFNLLHLCIKRIAQGKAGVIEAPSLERVRWEDVAQDLRDHYTTTKKRDSKEVEKRLKPLGEFFKGRRVRSIGPSDVTRYVKWRQTPVTMPAKNLESPSVVKPGKANGTINRELGILNKALRLAARHQKLARLPIIELLAESKAREGFFERDQYEAVRGHLRSDLQVATDIAYALGWRIRNEILTLTWPQVNLKALTLRLEPGTTKNREGRLVPLRHFPHLVQALHEQRERVRALEAKLGRVIPYVFPHLESKRPELLGTPSAASSACGRPRVSGPGSLRNSCMTSAGPPCGIWSGPGWPARSRCRSQGTRPSPCTSGTPSSPNQTSPPGSGRSRRSTTPNRTALPRWFPSRQLRRRRRSR
jgi:integrase